jgi:hypothetical protein
MYFNFFKNKITVKSENYLTSYIENLSENHHLFK